MGYFYNDMTELFKRLNELDVSIAELMIELRKTLKTDDVIETEEDSK
jgi:hypothetical protein